MKSLYDLYFIPVLIDWIMFIQTNHINNRIQDQADTRLQGKAQRL